MYEVMMTGAQQYTVLEIRQSAVLPRVHVVGLGVLRRPVAAREGTPAVSMHE